MDSDKDDKAMTGVYFFCWFTDGGIFDKHKGMVMVGIKATNVVTSSVCK